jgi:16S rRNA (adenine1518-N6/adenine1519-N6)-dimethyltransferase
MHGHQARKRFGQHFLVDSHFIDRIVAAIDPRPGESIVEIGPGLGALTGRLIARAGRIAAIEIDRDLAARLRGRYGPDQLTLVEADALDVDFGTMGSGLRIVGNLPYNISSPLLFHLAAFDRSLHDLHVMLQCRFAIERLFVVPPGAFRPAPKVDSAVARLTPLRDRAPRIDDFDLFSRIVTAAFSQRRKTLRNALSSIASTTQLEAAAIDPGVRGETLGVDAFVRLASIVAAR